MNPSQRSTPGTCRTLLAAAALAALAAPAHGQPYPSKPIRIIAPFAPGGAGDVVARNFAVRLTDALGQQVTVDNRVGAGGNIAAETVARSAPDGYTILLAFLGMSSNPSLYSKLAYDPQRDFAPISMLTAAPLILCVHPSLPVKSARDLVALARRQPGQMDFPSAGNGSSMHLAGELFNMMAGVKTQHVPYKGSAPGVLDVMSGRIHFMLNPMPEPAPHIRSGKLKGLATSTLKPIAAFPDLPPLADTLPGYEVLTWQGFAAPAGTPKPIVDRLHAESLKAIRTPEFADRLRGMSLELYGSTPDQFAQFIRDETAKWAKVIKASGARVD
jgi:tripartite-type tricarboxylate transporter receptor subunit TctC